MRYRDIFEISSRTLGSYIVKASEDAISAQAAETSFRRSNQGLSGHDRADGYQRVKDRRMSGIQKATERLTER